MAKEENRVHERSEWIPQPIFDAIQTMRGWLIVAAIILAAALGNALDRQLAPALFVFAVVIASASVLAVRQRGMSAAIYTILTVLAMVLYNPRWLALFSAEGTLGTRWATEGAWAGVMLLTASIYAMFHTPKPIAARPYHGLGAPQRSVAYDLVLNTVSRIPTFVRRFRPGGTAPAQRMAASAQAMGNAAGRPELTPADFVCRALPTPPEPIRRWPPGKM
jgi:hypothetical protein